MYALVGCSECQALWIIEDDPATARCPRCGSRRPREKRRTFLETEAEDHAREVRASMLAARQDQNDAFADLDSFSELAAEAAEPAVSDAELLEAAGVDTDAVDEAAGRAGPGGDTSSQSRRDLVLAAVDSLAEPTEADIVAFAGERDVTPERARRTLTKLVRAGELTETGGVYRSL
jgi:DNA-directed RNA polymerase subunit RPC12/RpoP